MQVSGVVVELGFIDKEETTLKVTGNRFYASGTATEETVKYPFVTVRTDSSDAVVKCVLQPGWGGDLNRAHRGGPIRVSAHFVSVRDGPPAQVLLRECRVRDLGPAPAVGPSAAPVAASAAASL